MPFAPLDGQPLLTPSCTPRLVEFMRYRRFKIPRLFNRPPRYVYLWKRTYHLLENYWTLHESDYVYDSVLCELVNPCTTWPDCNENGVDDRCDVALRDCNGNGVPDDCDILHGTSQDSNFNGVPDECDICVGDANCDGVVNFLDIDPFVARLGCPSLGSLCNLPSACTWVNADINQDGAVTFADIDPFVGTLGNVCP